MNKKNGMTASAFDPAWVADPRVFEVNRLPAHADCNLRGAQGLSMEAGLDGVWKFHYAETEAQAPVDFYSPETDVRGWDDITVPGYIQMQGDGAYGTPHYVNTQYPWDGHEALKPPAIPQRYQPVGSYVRRFSVPAHWGKTVCVRFDGVETAFAVWCNGVFVGYSEDSFTPADFDLSAVVRCDSENVLAVRVYRFSSASWLEDQDFWRMSGIFRSVKLFTKASTHFADLHVQAKLDETLTHGVLEVHATLEGLCDGVVTLHAFGQTTKASSCNDLTICLPIDNPFLWSAEAPHLYPYSLTIEDETGTVVETAYGNAGFRRFVMQDGLMILNGKRIVFKGVNRHEWNWRSGRAISYEDMLCDVRLMKQNNINAVRTSHYPNRSEWYDLCDAYGIYLIDETNLETHGTWQRLGAVTGDAYTLPGDRPEWRDAVLDRANSMLQRDKNHPSVLIWSCGNESYGGKTLWEMSEFFRHADPTRLVHYEGIQNDRSYPDTSDMESQMYTPAAKIPEFLEQHPEKPFIMCEYMHAMGTSCGDMHAYTKLTDTHLRYQGGFIWDWVDQGILAKDPLGNDAVLYGGDFGDRPSDFEFVGNGLLYADRSPTPKLYEVKGCYADFEVQVTAREVAINNRSLFTDLSSYVLHVTIARDGKSLAQTQCSMSAAPGETACFTLPLSLAIPEIAGEYTITANVCTAKDTPWAQLGHCIAFGQYIEYCASQAIPCNQCLTLTIGDVNIGVQGADFSLLFTKNAQGNLISYRWKGKELLERPVMLNFWRAPTDNDAAARMQWAHLPFKTAGMYAKLTDVNASCDGTTAVLTATYAFAHGESASLCYTITGDGAVRAVMTWLGQDYDSVPEFGLQFALPADYRNVNYYGFGPGEAYADFTHGVRLGSFAYDAHTALEPYFNPQESGARMGVRKATVTRQDGAGLCVFGDALMVSALPYTPHEIENARHAYELPPKVKTIVRCAKGQLGIGGDDTWGAKPHAEYIMPLRHGDTFCVSFCGTDTPLETRL